MLNVGFYAEQFCSLRGQCLAHASRQMSLAGLIVWEYVEDPEGRRIELQSEPSLRALFLLDNGARTTEKLRDFFLFAWLSSQNY